MKFDTTKEGLHTLFKPYQSALLNYIWDLNGESRIGIASGQAFKFLQETGESELMKSRASIISFFNDMVRKKLFSYEEKTGKGGFHKIYFPEMNRMQFAKHFFTTIADKLLEVFLDTSLRDSMTKAQ